MIIDPTYGVAPVISEYPCTDGHTRIMFNKCFTCGQEFEGFNEEIAICGLMATL